MLGVQSVSSFLSYKYEGAYRKGHSCCGNHGVSAQSVPNMTSDTLASETKTSGAQGAVGDERREGCFLSSVIKEGCMEGGTFDPGS